MIKDGGWALMLGQKAGSEIGSEIGSAFNDCDEIRDIGIRSQIFQRSIWVLTAPQSLPQLFLSHRILEFQLLTSLGVLLHTHKTGKNGELSNDDENGARFFVMVIFQHLIQLTLMLKITYKHLRHQFHHIKVTSNTRTPEIPVDRKVTVKCPTEAQELKEPVGTLVDDGTKKIVEYRLVGKECIPVKEDIKIPDQIVRAICISGCNHHHHLLLLLRRLLHCSQNLLLIFC